MDQADLAKRRPGYWNASAFCRTGQTWSSLHGAKTGRGTDEGVRERGSGITQACGTGACATAVAGVVRGKTKRKTKVIMDGGPLTIEWDERSGKVFMTGGAVNVFEGFIKV